MKLTYKDWRQDKEIAVDIETKDPFLLSKGPGVYKKDGYIIGVSFSNGLVSEYYPLQHPDTTVKEHEKNLEYIKTMLSGDNDKIFTHCMYDLDWLVNGYNIEVNGKIHDVQIAEPLINEYRPSYSLDNLGKIYFNEGKFYDGIRAYAVQEGFIKETDKSKGVEHLWRMPFKEVEGYPEKDTELTFKVFQKQKEILKAQDLESIYDLEMRLIPLLLYMRKCGVRIDEKRLKETGEELRVLETELQKEFNKIAGFEVNVNSSKDLAKLFKDNGLKIIYKEPTEKMLADGKSGNPSFSKGVLSNYDHEYAKRILELRQIKTIFSLYLEPYPEMIVNGRLHGQFNQLRTVSGRFTSSNPNLQQVKSKEDDNIIHDSELLSGQIIRKLFIPEEGQDWGKIDLSQAEYRLIAHYVSGQKSDEIRQRYIESSTTDYHEETGKMLNLSDRKVVKIVNFMKAYGAGAKAIALVLGWSLEKTRTFIKNYDDKVPFIKHTANKVGEVALKRGYIKTILGRRSRLQSKDKSYVMFNRLIQGSAADQMKKAMVDAWEAGIFEVLTPHLTVHDELDVSVPRTEEGRKAFEQLKDIMENCVKLKVPVIADAEIGPNWGELSQFENSK